MKIERAYNKIFVSQKGERWLLNGHPWVYESDIDAEEVSVGVIANGAIVDVLSPKGKYMGSGFYSANSKIRVRIISRNANDTFNETFWERRVQYALDYRLTVMDRDNMDGFRVIFGESDGFPGLTVDLFHDLLSVQVLSIGIERIKDLLFPILVRKCEEKGFPIRGLYERNDVAIRRLEGMESYKGWYELEGKQVPESAIVEMEENGIFYEVDVENGQKTGFFLDQKFNRQAVGRLAKGKTVLDCFTHTGSFAMNAAKGGAEHVTAVDISETAIEMARKNAERNGLTGVMDFKKADVFDLLPSLLIKSDRPYDFIILDPPAFTKSRKTVSRAEKGYKEINFRAMKLLPRGGYLATASCSHFMPHEQFERMIQSAAKDAGVELKQIEMRQQGPDHPILWNVPETDYLKFYLFQII
ncbi:MAG: class I SAM-dependent rRNA methyltransferase [Lachnospiraceae bacterium]|nr:class I SAM-dependent rRNA methyltransferase [Lachnospiraceae bacterium]